MAAVSAVTAEAGPGDGLQPRPRAPPGPRARSRVCAELADARARRPAVGTKGGGLGPSSAAHEPERVSGRRQVLQIQSAAAPAFAERTKDEAVRGHRCAAPSSSHPQR